jgi:hypothetical protein
MDFYHLLLMTFQALPERNQEKSLTRKLISGDLVVVVVVVVKVQGPYLRSLRNFAATQIFC